MRRMAPRPVAPHPPRPPRQTRLGHIAARRGGVTLPPFLSCTELIAWPSRKTLKWDWPAAARCRATSHHRVFVPAAAASQAEGGQQGPSPRFGPNKNILRPTWVPGAHQVRARLIEAVRKQLRCPGRQQLQLAGVRGLEAGVRVHLQTKQSAISRGPRHRQARERARECSACRAPRCLERLFGSLNVVALI